MSNSEPFESFVILAGMRTGSNLLEATLNAIRRVTCFGEAFNPVMMGWPDNDRIMGMTGQERDDDPLRLLDLIRGKENHLAGFRYFHDHDPRVLDIVMADRRCAKIVLTRNPLDSYVSVELARKTNQWKLNETETPAPERIEFVAGDFADFLDQSDRFQSRIRRALQASGQTAFHLGYDDIRDPEILTGLLHWLGRRDLDRVEPAGDQVPQNPHSMADKLTNYDDARQALADFDPWGTEITPVFEPSRGPSVRGWKASGAGRGLVFMPVAGAPNSAITDWLGQGGTLAGNFSQTSLRQWKRDHPGHRSFTVLRHPLWRAWAAFRQLVQGGNAELRQILRDRHRVALPPDHALADSDPIPAFHDFLGFLKRSLNGQTSLPVHPGWASQVEIVAGFAQFSSPDHILREADLARDLPGLTAIPGHPTIETPPEILRDPALQKAAKQAYIRDFIAFGFDDTPF